MSEITNLIKKQLDNAVELANINEAVYEILIKPKNKLEFNFPVKIDDKIQVLNISNKYKCTLREACYIYSLKKIEQVYLRRGF